MDGVAPGVWPEATRLSWLVVLSDVELNSGDLVRLDLRDTDEPPVEDEIRYHATTTKCYFRKVSPENSPFGRIYANEGPFPVFHGASPYEDPPRSSGERECTHRTDVRRCGTQTLQFADSSFGPAPSAFGAHRSSRRATHSDRDKEATFQSRR